MTKSEPERQDSALARCDQGIHLLNGTTCIDCGMMEWIETTPENTRHDHATHETGEPPVCFACGEAYADRIGEACQGCIDDGIACRACHMYYTYAGTNYCPSCLADFNDGRAAAQIERKRSTKP